MSNLAALPTSATTMTFIQRLQDLGCFRLVRHNSLIWSVNSVWHASCSFLQMRFISKQPWMTDFIIVVATWFDKIQSLSCSPMFVLGACKCSTNVSSSVLGKHASMLVSTENWWTLKKTLQQCARTLEDGSPWCKGFGQLDCCPWSCLCNCTKQFWGAERVRGAFFQLGCCVFQILSFLESDVVARLLDPLTLAFLWVRSAA